MARFATKKKKRQPRPVCKTRQDAMKTSNDLGEIFCVRLPRLGPDDDGIRFVRAGSNSAAVYASNKDAGGSVRLAKVGSDPDSLVEGIMSLSPSERKEALARVNRLAKVGK